MIFGEWLKAGFVCPRCKRAFKAWYTFLAHDCPSQEGNR
jgi:hypothetical protein